MIRSRLQARFAALLILVVLAAQVATYAVVQVATARSVAGQLENELQVGERVWRRFHDARAEQLLAAALVLADDFGFRAAVASGDPVEVLRQRKRLTLDLQVPAGDPMSRDIERRLPPPPRAPRSTSSATATSSPGRSPRRAVDHRCRAGGCPKREQQSWNGRS